MSVMHTEMDRSDELRMEWDPFNDNQVEGLFFPGAGRAELAEQLLHLLRYGPTLSLLVGPSGVGKRNLIVHLLGQMDRDLFDVAVVDCDVMLEFPQLLAKLDDPWRSLRPFTLDNYLDMVPAVASAADEESKTLVCILVGAQQLSASVLDHLQGMLAASAGLPVKCLMLVDAAELEAAPSLNGLVEALPDTTVLYLDPLDAAQTQEYLQYRMHTAGLGQVRFNAEQLEKIVETSGGIIGQINVAAREFLLEALPAPKVAPQKQPLPWMHIGALGAVVVVLLALFLSQPESDQPEAEPETETVVLDNPVQPLTESATDQLPFAEVARVAAEAAEPAAPAQNQPVEEVASSSADSGSGPSPAASDSSMATAPAAQPSDSIVRQEAPSTQSPSEAVTSAKPEPAPVAVAAKPVPSKPAAPAPAPKAEPPQTRTSWLQSLPADHYVLQLLGAQEEATVKRFLSQYPSLRKVTYYKTWRQGKPWYVVVQGDYPSYDAAKAAVTQLPAGLRQQNPWVRKVEAVRKEIPSR